MKYYTGVGSRNVPENILQFIKQIATRLESLGYVLRSGHAKGSDRAFEEAILNPKNAEIYTPWLKFGIPGNSQYPEYPYRGTQYSLDKMSPHIIEEAMEIAAPLHPAWKNLSLGAKSLHARNVFQVLGQDLRTPSSFLICYTKNGETKGGTATAINLALQNNIKVTNLGNPQNLKKVQDWINK